MADIRTREKVKDVRTIDRLQAATHHAKEGYVRTKEQLAEDVSGRESSPSGYASDQMEREVQRGTETVVREGEKRGMAAASMAKRKIGDMKERREEKTDTGTDEKNNELLPKETGTDASSGMSFEGEQAGWERPGQAWSSGHDEQGSDTDLRQRQSAGRSRIQERAESARTLRQREEAEGTRCWNQGNQTAETGKEGREKLLFGKTGDGKEGYRDGRLSGMKEESSLKRQDAAAKRDSWIRTKEQTGRDIKEPAHAAGNWNRPSFKHIWGGGRTVKTGEIREGIQASIWALPDHAVFRQKAWAVQSYQAAARKGAQTAGNNTLTISKGIAAGLRKTAASAKALAEGTKALGGLLWPSCGIAVLLVLFIALFGGFFLTSAGNDPDGNGQTVSQEIIAYTPVITQYARQYGIPQFVTAIQAMMMQESSGQGTDPMQSSECPFNTRFPNSPGAITEPEYSIQVGIQYFASCLQEAACESPMDMDRLSLAWQGYNYGNGYITWAVSNFGGYSEANALVFSQQQAASHGWSGYGDPQYVPHVMRYYQFRGGGMAEGGLLVQVAKSQLGNQGGQPYWSWYGFESRQPWCACFVSWCADQCGYLEAGLVPKFSACEEGIRWFTEKGRYYTRDYMPKTGDIIFFDWKSDGTYDHVGIVEDVSGGMVYTIEGNTSDSCAERSYPLGDSDICGYGSVDAQ